MTFLLLALLLLLCGLPWALALISHKHTSNWANGANTIQGSVTVTDVSDGDCELTLAAGALNTQVACAFTYTKLTAFYVLCTQDTTMYTNAPGTGSPAQTFSLKANVPFAWTNQSGIACPFTASVTSLYFSNGSGSGSDEIEGAWLYHA